MVPVVPVVLERLTCITRISDKVGTTKPDALRCLERMMATVRLSGMAAAARAAARSPRSSRLAD